MNIIDRIHDLNPEWLGWSAEERALIVRAQFPCPGEWFTEIRGRK